MLTKGICHIFTDGACSGNPGPAGIGVVLRYDDFKLDISENIGQGTNNIAELTAIKIALERVHQNVPIKIYSDSSYAIGVLTKPWKPKANQQLIQQIKNLMAKFDNIEFIKVAGHSGNPLNERANDLAVKGANE